MFFIILSILVAIGTLICYYLRRNYSYWSDRNVPGPKPRFLIGNFPSIINKKIHQMDEIDKIYKDYKGKTPVVGIYSGINPTLLVIDPDLSKKLMISDFSHFMDQGNAFDINKDKDPLFGRDPFFLKGEEWKEKRNEVAPAFTSARIKVLFPIMQEVANRMKKYIECELKNQDYLETRELCAKYTTDVVTSCIYGAESGSFSEGPSKIRDLVRNVVSPNWRLFLIMYIAPFFPWISKLINVRLCPEKEENFLNNLLKEVMKYRKDNKIERPDFVDFLIHLKEKKNVSDIDISAHAGTFFFEGIETSSITLSHLFYELAKNIPVQDKLREEIMQLRNKNCEFEYESIMENEYLEKTLYESLRKNPVLHVHSRECTKNYKIELPYNKVIEIQKGTNFQLAIRNFSLDSEYYGPDADTFNPDRFNDDNGTLKYYKDKGVLFPFGDGPRICLGHRFALGQMKCCIANILSSFEVVVSEKMTKNPVYNPFEMMLTYKEGILLKFKPISS